MAYSVCTEEAPSARGMCSKQAQAAPSDYF